VKRGLRKGEGEEKGGGGLLNFKEKRDRGEERKDTKQDFADLLKVPGVLRRKLKRG